MKPVKLRPFDLANYIRSEEGCRELLQEALEDGDPDFLADVQDAIARWRQLSNQAVPLRCPHLRATPVDGLTEGVD